MGKGRGGNGEEGREEGKRREGEKRRGSSHAFCFSNLGSTEAQSRMSGSLTTKYLKRHRQF